MTSEQFFNPPSRGYRVAVDGGDSRMIAVLIKHETREALVAATVLFEREGPNDQPEDDQ